MQMINIVWQTAYLQFRLLARAWPARMMDLFMPSVVVLIPVVLGRAVGGDEAGFNFVEYAHTADVAGFLLIGGGCFLLVTRSLWGFSNWLREEMRGGTLEGLYLSQAPMPVILLGVALALMSYSALVFIGAMVVGAFIFQAMFQTHYLLLALVFLLVGLPPLYGLALLYGALVLQVKETDAFLQVIQWLATLLMGVYFPITLFPAALRVAGLLFPPAWLANGLRGALLNVPFLSGYWLTDIAVLLLFSILAPWLGYWTLARVEKSLRAGSGLGGY